MQSVDPTAPDYVQTAPTNPDAPQQPLVDAEGNPTTAYGASIKLASTFDNFVKGGGDINKLAKEDLYNVQEAARTIPKPEDEADSPSLMYAKYMQSKQPFEVQLGQAALTVPVALGGLAIEAAKTGAKYWWDNTIGENGIQGLAEDLFNGATKGDWSFNRWQNYGARQESALVQQGRAAWDNYTSALPHGVADIVQKGILGGEAMLTQDPDRLAQLDFRQSEVLRQQAVRDRQYAKNMTDARDATADLYKSIGAGDFAQRLLTQTPTPEDLFAMGAITDPTTYLTAGAEAVTKGIASNFIKAGVRGQRMAEATSALNEVEDRISATQIAQNRIQAILNSNVPLAETTRAGYEAYAARLETIQNSLVKRDHVAATNEYQAAVAAANDQMDKMAKADPFRQLTASIIQNAGADSALVGKITDWIGNYPDKIVEKIGSSWPEEVQKRVADLLRRAPEAIGAAAGLHIGGIGGIVGGGIAGRLSEIALKTFGVGADTLAKFGNDLKIIGDQYALGQQTLPFHKALQDKLSGVPNWLVSKMDAPGMAALVNLVPGPATISGAAHGGIVGGALGYLQSGGNLQAAAQGVGTGAFFGGAGGGLGQIKRFNSLAELRQAAIGDRSRFIPSLTTPDRNLFLRLHPDNQLALSVYGMAHPDLDMRFFSDPSGVNGSWTPNNPRGTVSINVQGDNPLHAIAAHEIGHHIANHGLGQTVQDYIQGSPLTGQVGIMTALDDHGKPMVETDPQGRPRYVQTPEFEAYRTQYNARLLRDNKTALPADDYTIANEMFADLHAQYMNDPQTLQKMIRGHVPSDLVSENATANWLMKLGMGTDGITGNPIPTSALEGAQNLRNVIDNFYRAKQSKRGDVVGTRGESKLPVGDVIKGTPEFDRVQKNLEASGDLVRNPDGTIATDMAGRPITKTKRQADADHALLAKAVNDIYAAQPGLEGTANDNFLRLVTDRNGRQVRRGQRVPEAVFSELERTNQFNASQLINWRKMDGIMQRNDGSMSLAVYNSPTNGKGRYATIPARERAFIPVWTEVSPESNQVNITGYDPERLNANAARMLKTAAGRRLYDGQIGPALADVRTYLENLANDRPGETGIGIEKKGLINQIFGIRVEANPYAGDLEKKSPSVIRSFRLDRTNRVSEVSGANQPFREQTYEQLRSFMQPRATEEQTQFQPRTAAAEQPPDKTAIPVTTRMTSTGREVPVEIPYGITQSPLVAGKQPTGLGKDAPNDYKHIDFLGQLDQKRLTHLDNASAVSTFANKLVKEYGKWKDNPDVMDAKNWYGDVRGHLETAFGGDAELFAHLLAATSAGQGVVENWHDAMEAYRRYKSGAYDDLIQKYMDTGKITSDMKPRKANGAKFGFNSNKVLQVLAGTWLDEAEGPKTPNFFDNLFGRGKEATIDLWAARTMRRMGYDKVKGAPEQWRIQPGSEQAVSDLDFAFSQQAMRQAANRLKLDPHELQAILWYAEKHHWAEQGWAKGGAQAAKASYVPMLKSLAENVQSGTPVMEAIGSAQAAAGKGEFAR
jgi:hypothetical protein